MSINSRLKIMSLISALSCWASHHACVSGMNDKNTTPPRTLGEKNPRTKALNDRLVHLFGNDYSMLYGFLESIKPWKIRFRFEYDLKEESAKHQIEKTQYFYLPNGCITDAAGNPLGIHQEPQPEYRGYGAYVQPYDRTLRDYPESIRIYPDDHPKLLKLDPRILRQAEYRRAPIEATYVDGDNYDKYGYRHMKPEVQDRYKEWLKMEGTKEEFFREHIEGRIKLKPSPWPEWEQNKVLKEAVVDNDGCLRNKQYRNLYLTYSSTRGEFYWSADERDKLIVKPTTVELYGLRRN